MIQPGQFLLSHADGTIELVSSAKEAREKSKGRSICYTLQIAFAIGYNKAEQAAPAPTVEPEQIAEAKPAKRKGK